MITTFKWDTRAEFNHKDQYKMFSLYYKQKV